MKMFKKLMAVALTAVMAVSMLTGCSFADAAKQSALVKALNNESVQKEVTYKSADYEAVGKKIWEDDLKKGANAAEAMTGTFTKSGKDYVYYVTEVPADAKKSASWAAGKAANVHNYMKYVAEQTGKGSKKNIEIDVYFDGYKATSADPTTHFAVVIAKAKA
mgnify:FL=1